ncbi:MFS transporter [uncultured Jatrophihabitans sp.]|uniref:MFS transporter n=1 Tax=uncultured Jatrophihabitans sp. TaxID=1610747 RepID=UPI0035C943E9
MDQETIQKRRWGILAVLVLCLLVVIIDNTILNVALKTIQSDLNASQSDMQWAVDSYALVFAGLLITWGVLGDRVGRKRILMIGLFLFGAMSAVTAFAHSSTELIVFRALMGIGAAAVQPQTLSIIQNVFEPRERPKAIGIWAGASGMAIALGPITGGILLKYFWWGSVFLVNVPIVVVALVAIYFLVPESKNPQPGRLDPLGVLLSIVALVVLVYGVIEGGNSGKWLRWDTLGAVLLGVVLLALFIWTQHRSTHPTIDVGLFRNRHFSSGAAAIAAAFFALQGSTFYLAYYLQAVRNYSPLLAGVALIGVAAAVMIAAPLSARLSGRFGPRAVVGFGMTLVAIGLASYALATQHQSIWLIEVRLVAFGFGMGLTMSPATNAIMSAVPREKAGAGSAVNNTVRQVAGALGVAILGSVLVIVFRNDLGTHAPQAAATKLDRPAAVVSKLPSSQRVSAQVSSDSDQSIQNALTFAGNAADALQARGKAQGANLSPAQLRQEQAQARTVLTGFVSSTKSSFMSAMQITSLFGGLAALIGALVALVFLPGRREYEQMSGGPATAPSGDEAAKDHGVAPHDAQPDGVGAGHHRDPGEPIAAHAGHQAQHAGHEGQHEQVPAGGQQ